MILDRLFKPRATQAVGRALYAGAVSQARSADFYGRLAAPDSVEGRFELYALHVILLLDRLRRQGEQAGETSQALFDTFVRSLDDALREMGVGDLSVGKKMRKLAEAFYGRVKSYETALAALPERAELEAVVGRTVFAGQDNPQTLAMVDYVVEAREALARQPLADLLAAEVAWPTP